VYQSRYGTLREVDPAFLQAPVDRPHAASLRKPQLPTWSDHIQAVFSIGEGHASFLFRMYRHLVVDTAAVLAAPYHHGGGVHMRH
jgi:hypothetical protein